MCLHNLELRATDADAETLADNLAGEGDVVEHGLVHSSEGVDPLAVHLDVVVGVALGEDAALEDEDNVAVGKLLLELLGECNLDPIVIGKKCVKKRNCVGSVVCGFVCAWFYLRQTLARGRGTTTTMAFLLASTLASMAPRMRNCFRFSFSSLLLVLASISWRAFATLISTLDWVRLTAGIMFCVLSVLVVAYSLSFILEIC